MVSVLINENTSAEGNGIPLGGHGIKFLVPKNECSVHLLVSYRKIGAGHGKKDHFLAVPGFQWKKRVNTLEIPQN